MRIEQTRLDLEPPHTGQLPPPTKLLADLLLARFAELQALFTRHNAAADDTIDCRASDDSLPF